MAHPAVAVDGAPAIPVTPIPTSRWGRRLARGKATAVWLTLLVAGGFVLRALTTTPDAALNSDSCHYFRLAEALLSGEGFSSGGSEHPDVTRLPLFPALVAAGGAFGGTSEDVALFVVTLAGALLPIPLYGLGRRFFGPDAALAASALGAFSCLHGASAFLLPDPVALLLLLSATASAADAARRPSIARFARTGLLAGLAALTRAEAIVYAPLLVAAIAVAARRRRGTGAAVALACALALYAPYAAWTSARLGRFAPAPGIEYVRDARELSDRLGLRYLGESSVSWNDKARYMLDRSGERLLLETFFVEDRLPETLETPGASPPASDGRSAMERRRGEVIRRLRIVQQNVKRVPMRLRSEHLVPPAPWALALAGGALALARRSSRRLAPVLLAGGASALAPYYSHVESRFGYALFAGAVLLGAAAWGALGAALRRRPAALRLAVHAALVAGAILPALAHRPRGEAFEARRVGQREIAADAARALPPGPILAARPIIPYFAGRPYRALPIASPERVLAYARSVGATGLVLEGAVDRSERPALASWFERDDPPGLRRVAFRDDPERGTFVVYAVENASP